MDVLIAVVVTLFVTFVATRYIYNRQIDQLVSRQNRELDLAFSRAYDDGYAAGHEQGRRAESLERIERNRTKN